MNVLILTPDTDIDRRIILQANALLDKGYDITIIGSPYNNDNYLSGKVDKRIKIKRINPNDIKYDEKVVIWYFDSHNSINNQAADRNKFLNKFQQKHMKNINQELITRWLKTFHNKVVSFEIKLMNFVTTKYFGFKHKLVNVIYRFILVFVRLLKINFFPNFDEAFYTLGIQEDPDIIVANDLPSLKAAYRIAKGKDIPLIYDAHENYTEQCTLSSVCVKRLEKVEAEILPQVDFWIVPNEMLGQCMIDKYTQKFNAKVKDCLVVQNAIDSWTEYEKYKGEDFLRKKLGLSRDKKIVLFQGGFLAKRNLENLVRSIKYVKNDNVVLVMLGFGQFVEVLKKIVKNNHLETRVLFLDAVPQSELLYYTSSADVGVIPYPAVDKNTYYCSPNKLYEYIQARLPIVSNDLPFLRKMVVGNNIGKVEDFSNSKSIAKAIDNMFIIEEYLLQCKDNLDRISNTYSWEVEREKLINKYEETFKNMKIKNTKDKIIMHALGE